MPALQAPCQKGAPSCSKRCNVGARCVGLGASEAKDAEPPGSGARSLSGVQREVDSIPFVADDRDVDRLPVFLFFPEPQAVGFV